MASLPLALTGNVGDTILIQSNQIDAYGQRSTTTVTWSTSSATVATVNSVYDRPGCGLIYCLTAGSATITATAGTVNTTVLLTVVTPSAGVAATLTLQTVTPQPNKTMQTMTYQKV